MLSIDKLLGAARNLFVTQGYKSTTLEKIAHAANLTKGSVYFYFRSKEAVLLTLLDRAEQNVIDTAVQAIEQCDGPSLDKIVAFLHHQARLEDVIREDMLLIIHMSLEFPEGRASKRLEELYRKLYSALEEVMRAGQIAGDIRSDIPPRELASILVVNHDGTFMEWYRRSSYVDGKSLVRALRSIVLDGLRVDQGRPMRSQSLVAKPEGLGAGRSKPRAARLS